MSNKTTKLIMYAFVLIVLVGIVYGADAPRVFEVTDTDGVNNHYYVKFDDNRWQISHDKTSWVDKEGLKSSYTTTTLNSLYNNFEGETSSDTNGQTNLKYFADTILSKQTYDDGANFMKDFSGINSNNPRNDFQITSIGSIGKNMGTIGDTLSDYDYQHGAGGDINFFGTQIKEKTLTEQQAEYAKLKAAIDSSSSSGSSLTPEQQAEYAKLKAAIDSSSSSGSSLTSEQQTTPNSIPNEEKTITPESISYEQGGNYNPIIRKTTNIPYALRNSNGEVYVETMGIGDNIQQIYYVVESAGETVKSYDSNGKPLVTQPNTQTQILAAYNKNSVTIVRKTGDLIGDQIVKDPITGATTNLQGEAIINYGGKYKINGNEYTFPNEVIKVGNTEYPVYVKDNNIFIIDKDGTSLNIEDDSWIGGDKARIEELGVNLNQQQIDTLKEELTKRENLRESGSDQVTKPISNDEQLREYFGLTADALYITYGDKGNIATIYEKNDKTYVANSDGNGFEISRNEKGQLQIADSETVWNIEELDADLVQELLDEYNIKIPADELDSKMYEIEDMIEQRKQTREFLSQGLNIPIQFGQLFGQVGDFLGLDEWNEGWQRIFPDWMANFYSIDNFVNAFLCELPTKKDSPTSTVFFGEDNDFLIGAHLEGYKTKYSNRVMCGGNDEVCTDAFKRSDVKCSKEDVCTDANNNILILNSNIYRITFLFDPSDMVVQEDKYIEFDVVLKPGYEIVDLSGDKDTRNDRVRLESGSGIYQKAGSDIVIFVSNKEYTEVCMEFKNSGDLTNDFRKLLNEVSGSDNNLCNSLVTENYGIDAPPSGLVSLFTFGQVNSKKGISDSNAAAAANTSTTSVATSNDWRP